MSKSYCVVIRQLTNQIPVVTAVIAEPKDSVDDLEHYFKSAAEDEIQKFRKNFTDFSTATFYIQMFNDSGNYGVQLL